MSSMDGSNQKGLTSGSSSVLTLTVDTKGK